MAVASSHRSSVPTYLSRILGRQLEIEILEAVVLEQIEDELQGAGELLADLFLRAVDVGVVLGEAACAGEAVHDARLLVAVHRPELEQPQRQFPVGPSARAEDQVVHRAVHRLDVVILPGLRRVPSSSNSASRCIGGNMPSAYHSRCLDTSNRCPLLRCGVLTNEYPASTWRAPRVVLELLADDAALGVEDGEPRTEFVREAEQVEFRAELAVIALLGLLQHRHVRFERLVRLPRGAIDALQVLAVLVATPVGGGTAGELERGNVLSGRDVRAAAQVTPHALTGARVEVVVDRQLTAADLHHLGVIDRRLGCVVSNQFELERLADEFRLRVVVLDDATREALRALDDLLHSLFELGQVLRGEGPLDAEVVVEAVADGRADTEFRLGELLLDGLRQHVRSGVPDDAAPVLGVGGDRLHLDVGVRGPGQVAQVAVGVADDHDRVGTLARQTRFAHRGTRRRPGRHPNVGGGGECGWCGHGDGLLTVGSNGGADRTSWYRPVPTGSAVVRGRVAQPDASRVRRAVRSSGSRLGQLTHIPARGDR